MQYFNLNRNHKYIYNMNLLLIGFILLLIVIIIWILFKINDQSRQISATQLHTGDMLHTNLPIENIIPFIRATIHGRNIQIRLRPEPEPEAPATHGTEYYETIQYNNHADDTQNVHDSTVIKELKRRYDRLMELNQKALTVPAELEGLMTTDEYADAFCHSMFVELGNYCQSYFDPIAAADKFNKARKVIETAGKGSIFAGFIEEIREDWILAHVWYRIHSEENSAQKEQLLNALMDQLQDAGKYAAPNGVAQVIRTIAGLPLTTRPELTTECTTGRIGRYFQTFTFLDVDPILQSPIMDEKEYENEAYSKSYTILTKTIDATPGADLLYHNPDESTLSHEQLEHLASLKDTARKAIAETIRKDYDGIVPAEKLDKLIEKCIAGV
jgi:hypothetical protein